MDEQHFDNILLNKQQLLCNLLPPPHVASQSCKLRMRLHSQLLPQHPRHLMDSNYIIRMLYKISTDFTTTTFIFMFKNWHYYR